MGALYYLMHVNQLWRIIQWKLRHVPVYKRDLENEPETLKECFRLLTKTSRSFAVVIQELNHELLAPIALFYLVARGADTIEDDMTIPLDKKVSILRNFHNIMETDGWQFHESHGDDRELLENFDVVIAELKKIKKPYYEMIKDGTKKMAIGMADYAQNTKMLMEGIQTMQEYERYCHYTAGIVGEGLTLLFVSSGFGSPKLAERLSLAGSMGRVLQKTNIIRDIHEDWQDGRRWYPKEIWGKHVNNWEDMFNPTYREQAVNCISEMVLDALKHVEESLYYMAGLLEQSVFNFVAIPQTMAIATLELMFRNPDVLERNIKITKGDACQIMFESTQNIFTVCAVYRRYARRIHAKNDARDPSYFAIGERCTTIEQFIESFPSNQDPKNPLLKVLSGRRKSRRCILMRR